MTSSARKKIYEWVRQAEALGWTVEYTGNKGRGKHLKWRRPTGEVAAVTPSTPSGGNRSLKNTRAALRRVGLDVT